MIGYTKLFASIIASTIWREDDKTRIVWITMLALKNRQGIVEASIPGLADLSRVSIEDCRAAIAKLSSPDPDSRSKAYQGRRIKAVDGGWIVLNSEKYRRKMNADERREYLRVKQQESRARKRLKGQQVKRSQEGCQGINVDTNCNTVSDKQLDAHSSQQTYTKSTHTEAEAEAEAEGNPPNPPLSSAEIVLRDKELDRVQRRMDAIRQSYADHQVWSSGAVSEFNRLKIRKIELKKALGIQL